MDPSKREYEPLKAPARFSLRRAAEFQVDGF
jgi:hypothetical protein